MQPSAWMTIFLFDKWLDHFVACMQKMGGTCQLTFVTSFLIKDGHASHVIVDVVGQGEGHMIGSHYNRKSHITFHLMLQDVSRASRWYFVHVERLMDLDTSRCWS